MSISAQYIGTAIFTYIHIIYGVQYNNVYTSQLKKEKIMFLINNVRGTQYYRYLYYLCISFEPESRTQIYIPFENCKQ